VKYPKPVLILILLAVVAILVVVISHEAAESKKAAEQEAAHKAFVGDAPKSSPAYNIMDYTKNPKAPAAGKLQ